MNCAGIGVAKRVSRRVKETNAIEPHDLATLHEGDSGEPSAPSSPFRSRASACRPPSPSTRTTSAASSSARRRRPGKMARSPSAYSPRRVASVHDVADRPRFCRRTASARLDPAGPVPHADVRRPLRGSAALAGGICAVPLAPRQPHGVRAPGHAHLREPMINGECIRLDGALRMAPR